MPEFLPPVSSSTTEYYRPVEVFVVQPPKQRYWLHIVLLLATIFTTLVVGARMEFNFQHNEPFFYASDDSVASVFPLTWALQSSHILLGIPFSLTLMLILMAHEMGHYLYCRYYGVDATMPFFVPFPSLFGTMGAFIRIRSPIRSRAALFDIGVAGPIAGFATALLVLLLAFPLSKAASPSAVASDIQLQYPLIFRLVWAMIPQDGTPLQDVYLHPAAIAAWVGMFATALNLLPGGQLDGGHIVFSLAPRAHKTVSRLTILALIPMALYFWAGWLIWAILLRISGMRHPMVAEWPGVTGVRRWVAGFGLVMLILTLAPAPFGTRGSLLEILRALQDWLHQLRS
jgi:hypothetical protein